MEEFITTVAQNAVLMTVIALCWCGFSFAVALVLGKAIRRGMGNPEDHIILGADCDCGGCKPRKRY